MATFQDFASRVFAFASTHPNSPVLGSDLVRILGDIQVVNGITGDLLDNADPTNPVIDATSACTWKKASLTYDYFSTAATSFAVRIDTLLPGEMIHCCVMKPSEAFTGGLISAYTIKVGIGGTTDKYLDAGDVFITPDNTVFYTKTPASVSPETFGHTTQIFATATSTGDNLDAATTGAVDIWLLTSQVQN